MIQGGLAAIVSLCFWPFGISFASHVPFRLFLAPRTERFSAEPVGAESQEHPAHTAPSEAGSGTDT